MRKVMKKYGKRLAFALVLTLCLGLMGCGQEEAAVFEEIQEEQDILEAEAVETPESSSDNEMSEEEVSADTSEEKDLVILYTNDIHCSIDNPLGYAQLAAYRTKLTEEGKDVLIVDAGDYVQGAPIGTVSKGEYLIDVMNEVHYDVATVGNHEFDYGFAQFKKYINKAQFPIVCCNLIDERSGEQVLPPYQMFEFPGRKVAFVGVTTPGTLSSSNPGSFKDSAGNLIYGFCQDETGDALYNQVQESVDAARADGADIVILLSHLGIDASTSPWMSTEVITNTTGIDAVIDGHSHSVVASEQVKNKDGKTVILTQTGSQFANIGSMTISRIGSIKAELMDSYEEKDEEVQSFIDDIKSDFEGEMSKKIGTSEVDLVINDPETGERIVRNAETNAGDFCADACRFVTGAEVAIVNGGGVRCDVEKGDLTYGQIISLHPFANTVSVIEVTGQQILDALEKGVSELPNESGGFLQVSGMTYEIDMNVPSSVKVDDTGAFVSVDGEYRVKNVKISGKDLDVEKNYVLAGIDYILRDCGDGYTMFKDAKRINESFILDSEVVVEYVTNGLNGHIGKDYADPYGEGRIIAIDAEE